MKISLFAIFLLLFSTPIGASTLTWEDCLKLASEQNPEIKSGEDKLEGLKNLEHGSLSGFLPQISASLNYNQSHNGNTSVSNVSGASTQNLTMSTLTKGYSATLSGTQNLFAGFQDYAKYLAAKANRQNAEATLKATIAKVSYDLKVAFANLRYAQDYSKLTQEIIKRRDDNLRLVELRFKSGRENMGSVLLSRANLEQAKYDDLQARNAMRVSQSQLARTLGLDEWESWNVTGEIPVSEPDSKRPDLLTLATVTPDYLSSVALEKSSEADMKTYWAQFYPSLNLNGSMTQQDPNFFPDQTKRWAVGISLSIPLFTGGKDYYNLMNSYESNSAAKKIKDNTARVALAKLEQTYATYLEVVAKFKADKIFREAAQVRAEIARKRYNNGLLVFENWDIIENDLIIRQKNYLTSRRDWAIGEANWEQTQGKGPLR